MGLLAADHFLASFLKLHCPSSVTEEDLTQRCERAGHKGHLAKAKAKVTRKIWRVVDLLQVHARTTEQALLITRSEDDAVFLVWLLPRIYAGGAYSYLLLDGQRMTRGHASGEHKNDTYEVFIGTYVHAQSIEFWVPTVTIQLEFSEFNQDQPNTD
jgi:hypothetical protein